MSARDVDAHRSVSHTGSSIQNSRTSSRDTLQSLNGDSEGHDVVDGDLPTVTVRHSNPEHDEYLNTYLDVPALFAQMSCQLVKAQPLEPLDFLISTLASVRGQYRKLEAEHPNPPRRRQRMLSLAGRQEEEEWLTARRGSSGAGINFSRMSTESRAGPRMPDERESHPAGGGGGGVVRRRISISAECAADDYQVTVQDGKMIVSAGAPGGLTTLEMGELVLKTPKERDAILEALKQNIIFSALDNSILYQVADRVQTLHFPAGHTIIRRGEPGYSYYIICKGQVEVSVPDAPVTIRGKSEAFGEIALMYNSVRGADVISLTPCVLWSVDRNTFKAALQQASRSRRNLNVNLQGVRLLQPLTNQARALLGDVVTLRQFDRGERIVNEGDSADHFYIILMGCAAAMVNTPSGECVVRHYSSGDFFGELSIMNNMPRSASIVATEWMSCMLVSQQDFKDLIMPHVDFSGYSRQYITTLDGLSLPHNDFL